MEHFPDLYFHKFVITIAPTEELHLPEFEGSALRGVFGHLLRRLVCIIPHKGADPLAGLSELAQDIVVADAAVA